MPPSPSLALFSLLLFSTYSFAYTDSTGNLAFYSTPACQTPLFINNFTLGPDICGNIFSIDDALNTTIESYIINERPTCSGGRTPIFYTYQDAACYEGAAERSEIGLESDTSCVNSVQFVAMAFICNGFGNLDGNEWDNTDGNEHCESEGGSEEGNDEGGNCNGCTFGVSIDANDVYTDGATGDGCNGLHDEECVATSNSGSTLIILASSSTSPPSSTITPVVTAPSPQLPILMDSATTSSSTMAENPSTAATITSSTTAIPQHTASTTSAATLLTTASAKSSGSDSSIGVSVLFSGLFSTLAAALMLAMNP